MREAVVARRSQIVLHVVTVCVDADVGAAGAGRLFEVHGTS